MKKASIILNLSAKERAIVEHLQEHTLNIAQLSRATRISRATLYPYIETLLKRKVLKTSKKGKRLFYTAHTESELGESIISDLLSMSDTIAVPDEITYYNGLKQIQKLWLKVGTQPKHSRVVAFQTNASLQYSLSKMSTDVAKMNHKYILENKIILEQYAEEGMHRFVKNALKSKNISDAFPASDFTQRTTSTTLIEQGIFAEPIEFFILFDSVLFIDWKLEKGYEIKNPHIVTMYKKMFTLFQTLGKKIDNAEVTKSVFGE